MNIIEGISNTELIKITIPSYITIKERETQTLFLSEEFNLTQEKANDNMKYLQDKAIRIIEINLKNHEFIKITHKIWLTNINNPYEPDNRTQELIKQQYLNLPKGIHFFWTNYPEFCKKFILKWNIDNNINIQIRDVSEFKTYYGYTVYQAFLNQNLFANACDILKLQVICKYGGIYSDLGFSIKSDIYKIIKNFNIVINGEFFEPGIVSHNILCSNIKEHYLYKTILKKIDNVNIRKKYYNKIKNIWGIIELVSPRMITAAISSLCYDNDDTVLLIVNNEFTSDRYHNNSWFGEVKYGCKKHEDINYINFENDLGLKKD